MPLRDDLLNPIPGPNPAGEDLRYDPLYDKIKEARREDDDAPQGAWTRTRKVADWPLVIKLTGEALAAKTKDVQLAAWLTEALLKKEGFGGLREGLELCRGLIDRFWEGLYPQIDDGDAELRAAPLDWVGLKLDAAVRLVPLTRAGHDLLKYRESRQVGYEADANSDAKRQLRAEQIEEGRLTAEEWDKAFEATPKPFYKSLVADLDGTLERLQALDDLGREKFGDVAPGYGKLRAALEDVRPVAQQLLKLKLEKDPDPVEEAPAEDAGGIMPPDGAYPAVPGAARGPLAPEPTSRDDAVARLASVARYLRRTEPTSPASYLILRGLRWGELLAAGDYLDPRLLDAPPTPLRTQLKRLLLDGKWSELLEAAETVMSTAYGRGWLDLQRYVLAALDGLGADYRLAAAAVLDELRTLLAERPQLVDMTLMDDTPTANAETRAWLRDVVLAIPRAMPEVASLTEEEAPVTPAGRPTDLYGRALAEARGGRPERGVELLSRALEQETSRRGRFLRQTELSGVMVRGGLDAVARPILEELVQQIDNQSLEQWEEPAVVAAPMALLYRVIGKIDGDTSERQTLYQRVCKLDPVAAVALTRENGAGAESETSSAGAW